jgi:hypothetical protein
MGALSMLNHLRYLDFEVQGQSSYTHAEIEDLWLCPLIYWHHPTIFCTKFANCWMTYNAEKHWGWIGFVNDGIMLILKAFLW